MTGSAALEGRRPGASAAGFCFIRCRARLSIVPQLCYIDSNKETALMAKSKMIRARVEPALKHDAEAVLDRLGITPTQAITLFYRQVTLYRGLPFPVRIPNAATRKALREARSRRNIETFASVDTWKKEMRSL
jgi:DNA-damage-inducible protein J